MRLIPLLVVFACGSQTTEPDTASTTASTTTPPTTTQSPSPCLAPVVTLRTGPDDTCPDGGNEHRWPVHLDAADCHGWTGTDNQGSIHENSANEITCHPDGSFSFKQYAGNVDCEGTGVLKTYTLNTCEQDIPPSLYTMAIDLSCCEDPDSAACDWDIPSVSIPGGSVLLNGEACEE